VSDHRISVSVNGVAREVEVSADRLLVDLLREDLSLTGTKDGCGVGVCGLCAVLVDGRLLSACLVLAVTVDQATIETVEGLAEPDGTLSRVQDAFVRAGALQCGICTSGQVMAATALLREHPSPSREETRAWMQGSLCRCTGYESILTAIADAASRSEPAKPA
jgi:carbon-monoxide dehydrogenase small subunit